MSIEFLARIESELAQPGRHPLPLLKGLYRSMVSTKQGYWDAKVRRTSEDFMGLSPTKLVKNGILAKELRSRFQSWFLGDHVNWPGTQDQARALLLTMQGDPRWTGAPHVSSSPSRAGDNYFDGLTHWLHCRPQVQEELAKRATGIYALYRPSLVYPTRYVRGLMACFLDSGTSALRTLEVHRMSGRKNLRDNLLDLPPSHSQAVASDLEDILVGYMVQKSRQIQIHSVDLMTRSFGLTYLHTALRGSAFPQRTMNTGAERFLALDDERAFSFRPASGGVQPESDDLLSPFVILSGVASGTVGGQFFAYPCVYKRLGDLPIGMDLKASGLFAYLRSNDEYKEYPDIVPKEAVPDIILQQLRLATSPSPQFDGAAE